MFVTHASPSYQTLVDAQDIHDLKRWRWLFHSLHFHKHYTMYIGQNVMCRFSRIVPYLDSCLTYERFYSKFNYMFKCQVGKFEWRKYSLNIEISEHMCACVCVCLLCTTIRKIGTTILRMWWVLEYWSKFKKNVLAWVIVWDKIAIQITNLQP
jgi:hypothetical protein